MDRKLPYALLFLIVLMLQIFIFDRLMLSTFIAPLIYVSFIILLPIQLSQTSMLFWGLFVGVVMDIFMGTAGLNSIATIFVAYTRGYMIDRCIGEDYVKLGGAPTPARVGFVRFLRYAALLVFVHATILFMV